VKVVSRFREVRPKYSIGLALILVLALFLPAQAEPAWRCVTSSAPWTTRYGHTGVVHDGQMWVFGGCKDYSAEFYNDVWHSSDGVDWTRATAAAPWSKRASHTSVEFAGKMWIIGGGTVSTYRNDVWCSSDGVTWTQVTPAADWSPRTRHSSFMFDNKIWVVGGYGSAGFLRDVWNSSDGVHWNLVTNSAAWSARDNNECVASASTGTIWLVGGRDVTGRLNDVWRSSDGATWTRCTRAADWPTRWGHRSVEWNGKLWVLAGSYPGDYYNDVWSSADGAHWTRSGATVDWQPRDYHVCLVLRDSLWLIGGVRHTVEFNDVWSFGEERSAFGDGIYIGQRDVYDTRESRLKSLLNETKAHNFTELYLNVGNLDADGTLCWGDGSSGNPDKVKHFVEYFHNNYPQARLHAVLNGSTRGKPPVVRLGDPQVRQRISVECALVLWYTGLYGVTFDIEPVASRYYVWPEPFEAKMSFFLATVDSVANRVPIERISTYGESWVDDTRFLFNADVWSIDDYPLVKEHCDHVIDMAYSNLSTDDTPYVEWMTEQTAGIAERIPEGGFSIAVPSFNWAGGGHNPRRHTLQNALLGVKAAIPATAKIHVWDCPSMDVEDPFCGENEWFVFDNIWNQNALQEGVEITSVPAGPLKPNGGKVDIKVDWQTTGSALHTDIHWSRVETNGDTYPSGQGNTWSGSGPFSEILHVPEPPHGKKPYTICLVAHAYCGIANRYSEPKYVSVTYRGGGGQGSAAVVSPTASACEGAFPDPFSNATKIRYSVGGMAGLEAPVSLSVVDRAGRVVRQLVNQRRTAGAYSVTWDGRDDAGRKQPAGVYLYRLRVGEFSTTRKVVKSK